MNDAERLYRQPFDVARALVGEGCVVGPSAKFAPGALFRNRYYVGFDQVGRDVMRDRVDELTDALGLPAEALEQVRSEFARLREISFVGAEEKAGRLTHRIYIGFFNVRSVVQDPTPGERTDKNTLGVALGWCPGEDAYVVKEYDGRRSASDADDRALIETAMGSPDGADGAIDTAALVQACSRILARAPSAPVKELVRERGNGRVSALFNFDAQRLTRIRESVDELRDIARVLRIPEAAFADWHAAVGEHRLEALAIGVDDRGAPFVTVYTGKLSEPPALIVGEPAAGARGDADVRPAAACAAPPPPVFAFGELGIDFASRAERARFRAAMGPRVATGARPRALEAYVQRQPGRAESLVWIVKRQSIPVCVLRPAGSFADEAYEELLREFSDGDDLPVAVAGVADGHVVARDGASLPVCRFALRGLRRWAVDRCGPDARALEAYEHALEAATPALARTPRQRAIAFAATWFWPRLARHVAPGYVLSEVGAGPLPFAAPGRSRWGVEFAFFDPGGCLDRPWRRVRVAVDVSDVEPVVLGSPVAETYFERRLPGAGVTAHTAPGV